MRVLIGVPTHDGRIDAGTARAIYATPSQRHAVSVAVAPGSLIDQNCNALWCSVLANRDKFGWFAMLHSDVQPDDWWIDTLIEEADKHHADVMSAVCCIKSGLGLTSTALASDNPEVWNPYCRLTLRQINSPGFPETFGIDELAQWFMENARNKQLWVNTGCMVVRLGGRWDASRVYFSTLSRNRTINGVCTPEVMPEDWNFSRLATADGAHVSATRKVKTIHKGIASYDSSTVCGWERDLEYERSEVTCGR